MTYLLGYFSRPSWPSKSFFRRLCFAIAHCTIWKAPQAPKMAAGSDCVARVNSTHPQISYV